MKISVIIATHNDAFHIGASLKRLRQISRSESLEVIVVDGHSEDDTAVRAREWADQVLVHERANSGEQLHLGTQKATGFLLLFLRADTQLFGNWQQVLEHYWLDPRLRGVSATAFSVDFGSSWPLRLAACFCNSYVRWFGRAGLYQGLCLTAELYRQSGGFPPLDDLEACAFCERLRPFGRVVLLPEHIWPSAGRLHRYGVLGCVLRRLWRGLR